MPLGKKKVIYYTNRLSLLVPSILPECENVIEYLCFRAATNNYFHKSESDKLFRLMKCQTKDKYNRQINC